jgi:homoserine O-acetyltransferase
MTAARSSEVSDPHSKRLVLGASETLALESGATLAGLQIAYQTYGTLNAERSNAILICHALTGDQHVANIHPVTGKPGWWISMVGPGKPIDTDRFFVVCSNVIGGCMGSTGPASVNPATGETYDTEFPVVTIGDMVRAQKLLIDHLGIGVLLAVVGGSMGGMQVLGWASLFPERVFSVMPIASAAKHSAQNIAFHEVGRQAVMADPDWRRGRYTSEGAKPLKGLSVARMAAHITYLSEPALQRKFGRNLQDRDAPTFSFDADFQVESYLRHQGISFVERFDANSYLYLTRAMDYFDLAADNGGSLAAAFKRHGPRFCLVSFTSDWLFPTSDSRQIVHALNAAGASVSFVEIETDKGHDAFLLEEPTLFATARGFLDAAAAARGLDREGAA